MLSRFKFLRSINQNDLNNFDVKKFLKNAGGSGANHKQSFQVSKQFENKLLATTCCPVHAALTAFVDFEYGNDATGVVEDETMPFQTIQAAVNALAPLATIYQAGLVYIRPGTYFGNVNLPGFISLYGSGGYDGTTIFGTVTVAGNGSLISNLVIFSQDAPALISNVDPDAIVILLIAATFTLYTTPVSGANSITVNSGLVSIEDSATQLVVPGAPIGGFVATVINNSAFDVATAEVDLSVNGNAPEAYLILSSSTSSTPGEVRLSVSSGHGESVISTGAVVNTFAVYKTINTQISSNGFRLLHQENQTLTPGNTRSLLIAGGTADVIISSTNIDMSAVPLANQRLAIGLGSATARIDNIAWKSTPVPRIQGNFAEISYAVVSESGSSVLSGGQQVSIRETTTNTTATEGDFTIVATVPTVIITLPDPIVDSAVMLASGKIYNVINGNMYGPCFVKARFYDGSTVRVLAAGEHLTFIRTNAVWYIAAR
jgi:hypothetical protein